MSATFLPDLSTAGLLGYSYLGTITSNTTTNGTGVDCLNVDGPVYGVVITGDCGDATTTITVNLTESSDNTTFTAITGASVARAASATANDNVAFFVKEDGNRSKRYVRAEIVTASGSSISVPIAVAILGRKKVSGSGGGTYTGF